ncbi:MAG: M23 family metallopeptidase [Ilumatobacteraceae bacterium]
MLAPPGLGRRSWPDCRLTVLSLGVVSAAVAASVTLDSPPIDGTNCYYANTWGAPRSGGRTHEGVDICRRRRHRALRPAHRASDPEPGSLAGNQAKIVADGTTSIFAHLSAYADTAPHGATVPAGTLIGYVGKTGNTSVNHLHFEVHPQGGRAVDPTPVVAVANTCGSSGAKKASPALAVREHDHDHGRRRPRPQGHDHHQGHDDHDDRASSRAGGRAPASGPVGAARRLAPQVHRHVALHHDHLHHDDHDRRPDHDGAL